MIFFLSRYIKQLLIFSCLLFSVSPVSISAEILERVVAIVDDEVVLLSEFKESFRLAEISGQKLTDDAVINQMINRIILLREAKKFGLNQNRIDQDSVNSIVDEFINRRIKAFIHIPYDDIELYYNENDIYKNKEFYDVKDEIEQLLVSWELVHRLSVYIKEQRQKAYIRVQLTE